MLESPFIQKFQILSRGFKYQNCYLDYTESREWFKKTYPLANQTITGNSNFIFMKWFLECTDYSTFSSFCKTIKATDIPFDPNAKLNGDTFGTACGNLRSEMADRECRLFNNMIADQIVDVAPIVISSTKTDTLFDLIETAQDKLGAVMDGTHTKDDLIIIRDALIEANKMRIALERIEKIHSESCSNQLARKALQLIEYTQK